jgi:hypothetical protein
MARSASSSARPAGGPRAKGPFSLQSGDTLRGNGDITRHAVLSLARLVDGDLAAWIAARCSFANAMVDCILSAGHQILANAGELLSVETIAGSWPTGRSPPSSAWSGARRSRRASPPSRA